MLRSNYNFYLFIYCSITEKLQHLVAPARGASVTVSFAFATQLVRFCPIRPTVPLWGYFLKWGKWSPADSHFMLGIARTCRGCRKVELLWIVLVPRAQNPNNSQIGQRLQAFVWIKRFVATFVRFLGVAN